MAKKHIQINFSILSELATTPSSFIGFAAKVDGLYLKIESNPEVRLLTALDITNLFYKPGLSGGQVAIGGTGVNDKLILQSTTANGTLLGIGIQLNVGNAGATKAITILNNGNVGINIINPTAKLHLKTVSTSPGTAPLKIESGYLLTDIEDGAIEYDGMYFYGTNQDTRQPFSFRNHSHGYITWDGRINFTANLVVVTGTDGYITTRVAGTSNQFLNGLSQWATPVNTTYGIFTTTLDGLVPKSVTSSTTKFLRADGQWIAPVGIDISAFVPYTGATTNVNLGTKNLYTTTGKIGISTTSPLASIHIVKESTPDGVSAIAINPFIDFGTMLLFGSNEYNAYIQTKDFIGSWSNTILALQPKGGKVGVGCIEPSDLLSLGTPNVIEGRLAFAGRLSGLSVLRASDNAGDYTILTMPGRSGTIALLDDLIVASETKIGTQDTSATTGTFYIRPQSPKINISRSGGSIYIGLGELNSSDVGLGNVTNDRQWHIGYHPTTIAGYGITDAFSLPGLTNNYLPKSNGSSLVNSSLIESGSNLGTNKSLYINGSLTIYVNPSFGSTISMESSDSDVGAVLSIPYGGQLIGMNYDGIWNGVNIEGILNTTNKITTPSIQITSGASTGLFLKCIDSYGNAEWSAATGGTSTSFYKGPWNASTNTPTIQINIGTEGFYYKCTVAGTFDYMNFMPNDEIYFDGADWIRIPAIPYTLTQATSTVMGGLKIDDTTLKFDSGQLKVQLTFNPAHFTRVGQAISLKETFSGDSYVPYLGANKTIDIGNQELITRNLFVGQGPPIPERMNRYLRNEDGSGKVIWSVIPTASNFNLGLVKVNTVGTIAENSHSSIYIKVTEQGLLYSDLFVPYQGARMDVDLNTKSIFAYNFILQSDLRLKCEINQFIKVKLDIDYKQYKFKTDLDDIRYGVIAQDILKIAPEFVKGSDETNYSVKYIDLLVYEIAYLKQEVTNLQNKVYANN